jgi:hypothetical protein
MRPFRENGGLEFLKGHLRKALFYIRRMFFEQENIRLYCCMGMDKGMVVEFDRSQELCFPGD